MLGPLVSDVELCERLACRNHNLLSFLADPVLARQWLARRRTDALQMASMRALLLRHESAQLVRLTDDEVIDGLARLMSRGQLHVHTPALPATTGIGDKENQSASSASAFPLSERRGSRSASSPAPSPADPPTFPSTVAFSSQAATLVSAAAAGAPFCPL